jgi:hypothetical protein
MAVPFAQGAETPRLCDYWDPYGQKKRGARKEYGGMQVSQAKRMKEDEGVGEAGG